MNQNKIVEKMDIIKFKNYLIETKTEEYEK